VYVYLYCALSLTAPKSNSNGNRVIIPAKAFARDYVITGVGLSVCLFVCYHDNSIKRGRIWTKFFEKVPRGKSKTKFVCGYDC